MKCAALTKREQRYQQVWRKDCEHGATQVIQGIPLCGIHVNALAHGPIRYIAMLETPPEFKEIP